VGDSNEICYRLLCPQASAFVTDLYMGTSNQNASFGNAIGGKLASAGANGLVYNFTQLDHITTGLAAVGVGTPPPGHSQHLCCALQSNLDKREKACKRDDF
jgi:hypothetical protein